MHTTAPSTQSIFEGRWPNLVLKYIFLDPYSACKTSPWHVLRHLSSATLLNHDRLLWSPLQLDNIAVLVDHYVSKLLLCPQRPEMSQVYCRAAITNWNYCWTRLCSALVPQCSKKPNIVALLVALVFLHYNESSKMPHHSSELDSGFLRSGLQR